jgi:hypothetical protein
VTPAELRETYLRWTRRATPALLLPLVLTAVVQAASGAEWWNSGPQPAGAARYLFLSVAAASVVTGRSIRAREVEKRPLPAAALVSLSWQLATYALAPVTIGAVLAFMTRQVWDYYALLLVTLVGVALLFPRYDQWVVWSSARDSRPAAGGAAS